MALEHRWYVHDKMHVYVQYVYDKVHVNGQTAEYNLENMHVIQVHESLCFKHVIIHVVLEILYGYMSYKASFSNELPLQRHTSIS